MRVDFAPGVVAPLHSSGRSDPCGENVGSGNAAELAAYVVEKGKPLLVLSK